MINITVEGKTYKIPNNLNELSIGDYQYIKNINSIDKFKYFLILLEYFGIEQHLAKKIESKLVIDIIQAITLMLGQSSGNLKHLISIDGVQYQFERDLDKLRFDQFIDLTQLTEDEKTITDNLHLIAAILYRPVVEVKKEKFKLKHLWCKRNNVYVAEKYDSGEVMERADIFKLKMNMEVVYGLLFFFSRLRLKRIKSILESSLIEEKKRMKKVI